MIVNEVLKVLEEVEEGDMQATLVAHATLMALNMKVTAAHCECLGMNAEN